MRAVIVQNGVVISAVMIAPNWNQPDAGSNAWAPPAGTTVVPSDAAGVGWTWDGTTFTPPPPNVDPPPIDPFDKLDVLQMKILFNHENRLRALEGKAALTPAQFRAAIDAVLSS